MRFLIRRKTTVVEIAEVDIDVPSYLEDEAPFVGRAFAAKVKNIPWQVQSRELVSVTADPQMDVDEEEVEILSPALQIAPKPPAEQPERLVPRKTSWWGRTQTNG